MSLKNTCCTLPWQPQTSLFGNNYSGHNISTSETLTARACWLLQRDQRLVCFHRARSDTLEKAPNESVVDIPMRALQGETSQSLLNTMLKFLWQTLAIGIGSDMVCLALLYLNLIRIQIRYLSLNRRGAVGTAESLAEHDWPPITVLIPAYNEARVIEATLRSLCAVAYPHMQVIVVDDGSEDLTPQIVASLAQEDSRLTLLRQPRNLGKALALNAGIAAAQADYVIVLDADTIPDANFLKLIIRPLLREDADAVAGNVKVGNRGGLRISTLFQSIEYVSVLNTTRLLQGFTGTITTIPGAAGAMRTSALKALGGYSSTTRAEDADLTLRLVNNDFRVAYVPQAIVRTETPSTWRSLYYQRIRWIYGNMQCIARNRRPKDRGRRWRFHDIPAFVYENTWKPPLEFCRALVPILTLGGLIPSYMLYGYFGLMLLNWLVVASSYRIEAESSRELLLVPLQYALWPIFMIVPYCVAVWHFLFRHQVAWRRPARTGAPVS